MKTELIYDNKFISKKQMKLEIFEYIGIWYNKKEGIQLCIMQLLTNLITKI
ncbi:IS3 family transposase [Flavobacterium sp. ZT3R17]|uniref:IS3 family transposase n=1 Tax=Flavobacterium cryoconiti TaxID=3398736 RepID=UPI003A8999DC